MLFRLRLSVLVLLAIGVTACASGPTKKLKSMGSSVGSGASKTVTDVRTGEQYESVDNLGDSNSLTDAALTPLEDLNLRKDEIPEVLLSMDSPYEPPEDRSCKALRVEIVEYDRLLGPDFDDEEQYERSTKTKALTAVSSVVGGVIPFRGLVRTATGAKSYDKTLERAYRKGVARRGYLKGLWAAEGC